MDGLPEDMWTPYKHLQKLVESNLSFPTKQSLHDLETILKRYKHSFSSILSNPPKNEINRKILKSGTIDGLPISNTSRTIPLSKQLIDETITISDMFNLDEIIALELLCTAQREMLYHPGLTRGLVAVLLYYDGKKALASTLRNLFQATSGVSWEAETPDEITSLISSFTQSLVSESNVLDRIVNLLEELDVSKENALLMRNRALGSKKHQSEVHELYQDIRMALAGALFNWSAQRGLPKAIVIKLLKSLSNLEASQASGALDDVTVTILMALCYSCDTSALLKLEPANVLVQNLSIVNEIDFIPQVYETLCSGQQNGLFGVVKFAFGLALSSFRHVPQNVHNYSSKIIEHDEELVDAAIANKVFDFLYYSLLENKIVYRFEFYYRRIHLLITDFIEFMHSKVTELRGKADETARTIICFANEGLDPPSNLDHSFEMLMMCIAKFYRNNRSGLSLCAEYWKPLDASSSSLKTTTRSVSLFKFIRLAGELLPSTLFISYTKMIAGLTSCEQSARNAFNLLKQSSGLTGSTTLSWEHFFGSLIRYYSTLRQEQSTSNDTIYKNFAINRLINPQEIEGLRAVLDIIRAVATYDEFARIAICEHSSWAPIQTLIGLLCCPIPLELKADILTTLAALGKSKETAISVWNHLETSQIIKTIATTNVHESCNLEVEIDQNESRLESYPVTQGILDLLYSLVTTYVPKNLGSGHRKPGLYPYLCFIIDGIFLKFNERIYKSEAEKWEIGFKCLKLLHYLLKIYEPTAQDFDLHRDDHPPSGYFIMLQLHKKTTFLRLILQLIDEARMRFDEYTRFRGKEILEECSLLCLNIVENGLSKQNDFFDAHLIANSSNLLFGLNKILLDVNPRSQKPDHLLNTTKFVMYCNWLPSHSLVAINILHIVSKLPNVSSQIIDIFTTNTGVCQEIRQGFVECLEKESSEFICNSYENLDKNVSSIKIGLKIKRAILGLLQDSVAQQAPNIGMYLLGFESVNEMFEGQKLNIEPTNNCTKAVILVLDNHLELKKSEVDDDVEQIMERMYNLLYSLSAKRRTSDVLLRYLRASNDFLYRHLKALPFNGIGSPYVLNQMSHLLKCTAIELKLASTHSQISRIQHLCKILVGTSEKGMEDLISNELQNYGSHSLGFINADTEKKSNFLLINMLDWFDLEMSEICTPKWEFFDVSLLKQIFSECEINNDQCQTLINLKKLHKILNDDLCSIQSSVASGQRKLILQEIESIMHFALSVNESKMKIRATTKVVESWRQVIEILFSCAPNTALQLSTKQELMMEILQKLLNKVVFIQPILEVGVSLSEAALILFVNLRHCFIRKEESLGYDYGSVNSFTLEMPYSKFSMLKTESNVSNLKFVLKRIFEWIVISNVASQKLRINLYATALNCLRILNGEQLKEDINNENDAYFVTRLDGSLKNNTNCSDPNQFELSTEIFMLFGDKLLDIICQDCVVGYDICKMLAMSCLVEAITLQPLPNVIHFINNRGYLSNIIENLNQSDDDLCETLCDSVENMKAIYVYESQMALLLSLASCKIGAEILLSDQIIGVLCNMKVFDMHSNIQRNLALKKPNSMDFMPSLDERFRQILFPALHLCHAIISTLGSANRSALLQIVHFLFSHYEMIEIILRTGTPYLALNDLKELSIVTGLIARTMNQEIHSLDDLNTINGTYNNRLQRLMLSLYTRLIFSDNILKESLKQLNQCFEMTEAEKMLYKRYFLEIFANLTLYIRNAILPNSSNTINCIFMNQDVQESRSRNEKCSNSANEHLSISTVLSQLKGSMEYFTTQKGILDNVLLEKASIARSDCNLPINCDNKNWMRLYRAKKKELVLCSLIIEQTLYLLWVHLNAYFRTRTNLNDNLDLKIQFEDLQGKVTRDQGTVLKQNLISMFNETFCKQLVASSGPEFESDKSFSEILLRRIKGLIQFSNVYEK